MVTRSNVVPVRRIITVSDVEGYSTRSHDDQRDLQNRIADIQERAAVNAGLSLEGAITQPRGDGCLTAWPPETSELDLIADYLREFHRELDRVNDTLSQNSKIRMRLAIAIGLVEEAVYGIPGQTPIRAALLADSHKLREALRKAGRHSLAVILDDWLYQDVVRRRLRGLRPEEYEKVVITDKYREEHTAWVAIPGADRRRAPGRASGSAPGGPDPPRASQPEPDGKGHKQGPPGGGEQQSPNVRINLEDGARAGNVFGVVHGDVSVYEAPSATQQEAKVALLLSTSAASSDEAPLEARWRAGEEGWLGDRRYLLLGDKAGLVREERDPRGQVRRQALARQTDPAPEARQAYAWLRRGDRDLTRERDLLARAHAASTSNATALNGARRRDGRPVAGFPSIAYYDAGPGAVTLALSWPTEKDDLPSETLGVRFPPGSLDAWQVSLLRAGIRGFVTVLERLHRLGTSHRNLSPESIIVAGNGQFALRDLGLGAVAFRPGEGPASYQAPEQAFGSRLPRPGLATDVYQLAAITYHLVTGRIPGRNAPPVRHPGLTDSVTDIISAALAHSPADRPRARDLRLALNAPKPTH